MAKQRFHDPNNVAGTNAKMRDKLSNRLDISLREMKAEMPMINPAFDPNSKSRRKNLGTTKDLAEKERAEETKTKPATASIA